MPSLPKAFYAGSPSGSTDVYTAPSVTSFICAIVTNITIANKTASKAKARVVINGAAIIYDKELLPNDSLVVPGQWIVPPGKVISVSQVTGGACDISICGVEMTTL